MPKQKPHPLSNSMSVEKIFIVLAVIIGLGAVVDLIYLYFSQSLSSAELIRCTINSVLAIALYLYFKNKHQVKLKKKVKQS